MSQKAAAERAGTSRENWANYELGRAEPPIPLIRRVAQESGIPFGWFTDGKDSPVPAVRAVSDPLYPVAMLYAPIPLGSPVPAGSWQSPEDTDDMIEVPGMLVARGRFACQAEGESMLPLIEQGDLLIFQSDPRPRPGLIVLARNGHGEVTVKVLRIKENRFVLESMNASFPDATADYIEHIGYLVAIWKREGSGKGMLYYDDGGLRP